MIVVNTSVGNGSILYILGYKLHLFLAPISPLELNPHTGWCIVDHLFCFHSNSNTGNNLILLSVVTYPVFQFLFFFGKLWLPLGAFYRSGISTKPTAAFCQSYTCFSETLNSRAICLLLLQWSAYCMLCSAQLSV